MKIIDSYDKLPLGVYLDIMALVEDTTLEEDDRQLSIIALLTGETEDTLLKLPILDFRKLAEKARFLEEEVPRPAAVPKVIRLGGIDLIPTTKITKITTAQFVDYQTCVKEGNKRLVEMLSCFLVPAGCEYNEGYDIDYVQNAIRDYLTVTQAQGLAAFFFRRWTALVGSSLIYSALMARRIRPKEKRKEMKEQIKSTWEDFKRNGDGSIMFALWAIPPIRRGSPSGK